MKIIVPCDFSAALDFAMQHAACLLRIKGGMGEVILLHVLAKRRAVEQLDFESRLQQLASDYSEKYGIECSGVVELGTIEEVIPAYAEDEHANLIIMATRGVTAMQKFFGSKAVKVIAQSNVPFLLVQQAPAHENPLASMLLPIGANKDERGKIDWAVQIGHDFNTKFIVLTEHYQDSRLNGRLDSTMQLLRSSFASNGIPYTEKKADKAGIVKTIMQEATEQQATGLMIMLTQKVKGLQTMLYSGDQEIIANTKGLPVFCVNPSMI